MRRIVYVTVLAAACASAPPPAPQPAAPAAPAPQSVSATALADRAGESTETAVAVPAKAPNDGFDWENEWIYNRYGRFRRVRGGLGNDAGRRYDIITIELADHSTRTVYFDITDNWNNWVPPGRK